MKPSSQNPAYRSRFNFSLLVLTLALGTLTAAAAPPGRVAAWGAGEPGETGILDHGQSSPPSSTYQGVLAVSTTRSTSAAILTNGSVVTWGESAQSLYAPPAAASSGVVALGTGLLARHFLAQKSDGTVVAWGLNTSGQVTGTPSPNFTATHPVTLNGQVLSGVVALSAGEQHSVALKSDGTVVAWGDNTFGQTSVPPGLTGVVAVSAGFHHTLVVKSDGTVVGWGSSIYGQLSVPVGLTDVVAVTNGEADSFALKSDGTVVAWGAGGQAPIGPPPVGLTNVVTISAGYHHIVALKSDGSIVGWGYNSSGQLTLPSPSLSCPITITAGAYHNVALVTISPTQSLYLSNQTLLAGQTAVFNAVADGSPPLTYQWFRNGTPLANTSRISGVTSPQLTITGLMLSDAGHYHAEVSNCAGTISVSTSENAPAFLAVLPAAGPGRVIAWGDDTLGQLAVPAAAHSGVVAVSAGQGHTLALKNNGSVLAWGWNASGQSTVPAAASSGVVAIAAGQGHSLALKSNGDMVAWGNNAEGQTNVPGSILPGWGSSSQVVGIAAGGAHSLAMTRFGTVVAWGNNGFGQCSVPPGLNGVTAIAAGFYHSVALRTNGTVVAWGDNTHGQSTVPSSLSGVVAISAGFYHTIAVKSDGSIVAWGAGTASTTAPHLGQSAVPTGLGSAVSPAAGRFHSVALMDDHTIAGWGDTSSGQTAAPSNQQGNYQAVAAGWMHNAAIATAAPINFDLPLSAYVNLGGMLHITGIADGTPPLMYQWQKQGAMGYANIGGATGPTLVLSNVQASQGGSYRLMASNGLGAATSAPVVVTTLTNTTFSQWRETQFNAAQLADPLISGPLATPASDGMPNLMKYAFNLPVFGPNPMAPAPVGPSGLQLVPQFIDQGVMRFDFHAVRTDLTYTVETSTDLGAGSWSANGVIVEANGTARTATFLPGPFRSRFFRITISQ